MSFFDPQFFNTMLNTLFPAMTLGQVGSALLAIVLIDLVLAGDNALLIGLAARGLPKQLQRKAILWGTAGAIIIRTLMTLIAMWLLQIPGLLLVGGLVLLWIAVKLVKGEDAPASAAHGEDSVAGAASTASFWTAMKTIVIADTVMGVENVIAVAGAAQGNFTLVVLGLLISIPIVMAGSQLVIQLVDKFPIIITIGAGAIVFTAGKMITSERFFNGWFNENPVIKWSLIAALMVITLGYGRWLASKK